MLFVSQTYHKSNSSSGYILEVDVKYSEELHGLHSDMPFLPNKMKVNKFEKLACNFFNKKTHVIHKSSEAGTKPWIDIRENTQINII